MIDLIRVSLNTMVWVILSLLAAFSAEKAQDIILYGTLRPQYNLDLFLFENSNEKPKRLTTHPGLDYNPTFSPDGQWVVFCSERNGAPDLFLLDLQTDEPPKALTNQSSMEDAPTFSPDGEKLAFVCTKDGYADIWVMPFEPDSSESFDQAINLTQSDSGDFHPCFSPDGESIVFSSVRDSYGSDVYLMNRDGSNVKRLTHANGWDGSPTWSKDGQWIYYYSEREGQSALWRMRPDGTEQEQVSDAKPVLSPAIAPDGRIGFSTEKNGKWLIQSVKPDGSDLQNESDRTLEYWAPAFDRKPGRMVCHGKVEFDSLEQEDPIDPYLLIDDHPIKVKLAERTVNMMAIDGSFPSLNPKGQQFVYSRGFKQILVSNINGKQKNVVFDRVDKSSWRPNWSKDGEWIVCTVGDTFAGASKDVDLWKLRPDGSDVVNLTSDSNSNDAFPYFSPDGKWITFRSGRDGNHNIYLINADGSNPRQLTDHNATDTMPAFAPDGKTIAFTSNRDGDYEIYTIELSERGEPENLQRITFSPGRDAHPDFSPDGKWIVFTSQRGGINDEEPLLPIYNPQPYGDLYAKRLENGLVVRLTHNKWEDGTPHWGVSMALDKENE